MPPPGVISRPRTAEEALDPSRQHEIREAVRKGSFAYWEGP